MSAIEMTLFEDLLLVQEEPPVQTTASGLHLPKRAVENPPSPLRTGRVLLAGPGRSGHHDSGKFCQTAMRTAVGDRVLYHKHAGQMVIINGCAFQIVSDHDIFAKLGGDVVVSQITS